jgi:hypothetical protein
MISEAFIFGASIVSRAALSNSWSFSRQSERFKPSADTWLTAENLTRADCEGGDAKRFGFSHLPLLEEGEYGVAVEMKSPHAPLKLSVLRELGVLELTYRRNFYEKKRRTL